MVRVEVQKGRGAGERKAGIVGCAVNRMHGRAVMWVEQFGRSEMGEAEVETL